MEEGNAFLRITKEWILATPVSTIWSLENPATSLLWHTNKALELVSTRGGVLHTFDACAYGSPHYKPTSWLTNGPNGGQIHRPCPGLSRSHKHDPLKRTSLGSQEEADDVEE